jgi:hypothetical protein
MKCWSRGPSKPTYTLSECWLRRPARPACCHKEATEPGKPRCCTPHHTMITQYRPHQLAESMSTRKFTRKFTNTSTLPAILQHLFFVPLGTWHIDINAATHEMQCLYCF